MTGRRKRSRRLAIGKSSTFNIFLVSGLILHALCHSCAWERLASDYNYSLMFCGFCDMLECIYIYILPPYIFCLPYTKSSHFLLFLLLATTNYRYRFKVTRERIRQIEARALHTGDFYVSTPTATNSYFVFPFFPLPFFSKSP